MKIGIASVAALALGCVVGPVFGQTFLTPVDTLTGEGVVRTMDGREIEGKTSVVFFTMRGIGKLTFKDTQGNKYKFEAEDVAALTIKLSGFATVGASSTSNARSRATTRPLGKSMDALSTSAERSIGSSDTRGPIVGPYSITSHSIRPRRLRKRIARTAAGPICSCRSIVAWRPNWASQATCSWVTSCFPNRPMTVVF